ncbi:MAG: hypothetical protein R3F44_15260 [Candidatus Competibacteraceae bacterium]
MISKNGWSVGGGWLKSIPGMLSLGHGLSVILIQLGRFEEALLRPKRFGAGAATPFSTAIMPETFSGWDVMLRRKRISTKPWSLGETEDRL